MKDTRNFCIIAHIDHGKSTLADRLLELTGTVADREMKEQLLDTMDLERERGITIKLQPVTMQWQGKMLNLIDTPGHADFSYEVSRTLAACEGALLLVDATQGIQAQTLANAELAKAHGLTIIPVVNKIDLPAADVEGTAEQIEQVLGIPRDSVVATSGKTGEGVDKLLEAIVERIPAPAGLPGNHLRALIFDSEFDAYRGVIAYVRVVDGQIPAGTKLKLMANGKVTEAMEVGILTPGLTKQSALATGQVGYVVTGLKQVADARVGDTLTLESTSAKEALPGYAEVQPMVFAGIYTADGAQFGKLREGLERLALNDASLSYEAIQSASLGLGFRCGFLGLLHMDIIRERLTREYSLDLVVTAPTVPYEILQTDGKKLRIADPADLPDPTRIQEFREPWAIVELLARSEDIGGVQQLLVSHRGIFTDTTYVGAERVMIEAEVPLAELVVDFYDALKGATAGYGSLSYQVGEFRAGDLVKLDILVAGDVVESLATIVPRGQATERGRAVLGKLKEMIPRALFKISLQAAIGGKVMAREDISAAGKNVTAKLYGGDVTRKRKLLEKQKKGKKRMKASGSVEIPAKAFLAVLKR